MDSLKKSVIYLDNAAATKPCTGAIEAFNNCAVNNYANPAALHSAGIETEKIITGAKKKILSRFFESGDLIFTSGATESNNTAVFGICRKYIRDGKAVKNAKIVSTAIEHPSVKAVLDEMKAYGFEIVRLSPALYQNSGSNYEFEQKIADEADENTVLVTAMAVNNETGFIIDTVKLYRAVKRKNPSCLFHTDAVQGFLKIPVAGDLISISSHKIHGIKGAGGLFIKNGIKIKPLIFGGGQQLGLRSGTESAELAAAFAAAVGDYKYDKQHYIDLTQVLMSKLGGLIKINSYNNLPNILNISLSEIKSEVILHFLAQKGIYVSSGSACARGKVSPVLEAFGISRKDADSAIRISFSSENTAEEVLTLAEALKEAAERFR